MEPVGFLGIIKLTTQIILKNYKHFLCIAILWVIPYAFFNLHVPDLSSSALGSLVGSSFSLYKLTREQYFPTPAALPSYNSTALPPNILTDDPFLTLRLLSLFPIIARLFFSLIIPLVSYPLLTYSVCRACLNKGLSLKGSSLGILRSAKNLALTAMCMGMLAFGFFAMTIGTLGIIMGVVIVVRGNEPATASTVTACLLPLMETVGLYLAISLSLAHTVAILEEKRGWGAMRRSLELVNGRKWVALGLACLFYGTYELCEFAVSWRWRGASIVRESLQALMALFSVAANVVLYVSCKGGREEEPLNTLIAAGAQFGPRDSSPKSMDLETAAYFSALPK